MTINFQKTCLLISLFLGVAIFGMVNASSGACSDHGGVNCAAGPGVNGNVVCNDGWANSTVSYNSAQECIVYPVCTAPVANGCSTQYDLDLLENKLAANGILGNSTYSMQAINDCTSQISVYQAAAQQYQACLVKQQSASQSVVNNQPAQSTNSPALATTLSSSTNSSVTIDIPAITGENTSNTDPVGTNISSNGTVYMITADGQKRPYTSAGAFLSYGFNSWSGVVTANSADIALPTGNFIPPRDGKIICSDRGTDIGTCYLITDGKKAAFTSALIFESLGFGFSHALSGDVSFLASAADISNPNEAHPEGVLVNKNGTIYLAGDNGLLGIPDLATLNSWGYSLTDSVNANVADSAKTQVGVMASHKPGALSPFEN